MRITQSMLQNNMLRHLFKSQQEMDKYFTQIYTGKKIRRPSEDPVIAMRGIGYRTELEEVKQYQRNVSNVWSWMDHADDALDKATKVMQRLEELAIQAKNDTLSQSERHSILEEVKQLEQHLITIANTSVNGRYIFNGTDTNHAPVVYDESEGKGIIWEPADPNVESGRDKPVIIEVSKGITFEVNIDPDSVFPQELFDVIKDFKDALNGDPLKDIDDSIGALQEMTQKIIRGRADLGARMNRLELIEDRLSQQGIIAEDIMKKNEGVDFEEAVMNLLAQEAVHRAALASGAKLIQPSLIDFLR
ncbi:MAG: flagellar hook-associated protein FlgL [Bacilli bacterium]|mgnify:CR=1 FL=1|nr:flagellar hook-associated protein FlgL [Bacilli bacterium]